MKYIFSLILAAVVLIAGCGKDENVDTMGEGKTIIEDQIAQFVPTELGYDASTLDERQKLVVENLYYASKIMDEIFLDQVYSKNNRIRTDLMTLDSEEAKEQLELFDIMFGPFDRLNHDAPFIGTEAKPKGANFYPEDMTKEEFEQWIKDHPEQPHLQVRL